jgi:hypothetical protein
MSRLLLLLTVGHFNQPLQAIVTVAGYAAIGQMQSIQHLRVGRVDVAKVTRRTTQPAQNSVMAPNTLRFSAKFSPQEQKRTYNR